MMQSQIKSHGVQVEVASKTTQLISNETPFASKITHVISNEHVGHGHLRLSDQYRATHSHGLPLCQGRVGWGRSPKSSSKPTQKLAGSGEAHQPVNSSPVDYSSLRTPFAILTASRIPRWPDAGPWLEVLPRGQGFLRRQTARGRSQRASPPFPDPFSGTWLASLP